MRKKHDKTYKAGVVLKALKEESTLQELATKYSVQANQKSFISIAPELFRSMYNIYIQKSAFTTTIQHGKYSLPWCNKFPPAFVSDITNQAYWRKSQASTRRQP